MEKKEGDDKEGKQNPQTVRMSSKRNISSNPCQKESAHDERYATLEIHKT